MTLAVDNNYLERCDLPEIQKIKFKIPILYNNGAKVEIFPLSDSWRQQNNNNNMLQLTDSSFLNLFSTAYKQTDSSQAEVMDRGDR